MMIAARVAVRCACAQVCTTQRERPGDQRHVDEHRPVGAARGQHHPARHARRAADGADGAELHDAQAERVAAAAPAAQAEDVHGVEQRAGQRERLAAADREALQRQQRQAGGGQPDGGPHRPAQPGPQHQRPEQRGEHDVHAGDEARHRGRRRLDPDRLQQLGRAVDDAEHHAVPSLGRRSAAPPRAARRPRRATTASRKRTARKSGTGTRSTTSLSRKKVEPQAAVTPSRPEHARGWRPRARRAARGGGRHPPVQRRVGPARRPGAATLAAPPSPARGSVPPSRRTVVPSLAPAQGPGHRLDPLRAAGRRAVGDRRRRRPGARRVRRPRLLPVVEQAEPGDGHQRGLPAPHPRGRPPVGARARLGHLLPVRHQPLAHPRADPAPALLLLASCRSGTCPSATPRWSSPPSSPRTPSCTRCSSRPAEAALRRYTRLLEGLEKKFADVENVTSRRKQARQAARAVLPNATETRIVVTGNYRAMRHFVAMRASEHADVEIRELAIAMLRELQRVAPNAFADFEISRAAGRHRGRQQPAGRRGLTDATRVPLQPRTGPTGSLRSMTAPGTRCSAGC